MRLDSYTDEDLQKELKRRDEERKKLAALPTDRRLAAFLHNSLCTLNHTDGCEWFYESSDGRDNWERAAHQRWLRRAKAALKVLDDPDRIMRLVSAASK